MHPVRGMISPAAFIPIAEATGRRPVRGVTLDRAVSIVNAELLVGMERKALRCTGTDVELGGDRLELLAASEMLLESRRLDAGLFELPRRSRCRREPPHLVAFALGRVADRFQ